ncbi:PrsW family glutamic-type intramembrane protease [Cellulosimicrobium arenosum]|uniref:PrsW family intramembrane metalloprotease n=1 Tax=Cellulosimicrobium arenosum TaxID=2708133 RepID=A0A927J1Q0_9MICO|nr:PrsW family glutamic-type intramembrane protease [Cellulosimicrobium arenosum]MBD8080309.1 PrsW family intramembrane metalloprotease [Cellulosimicrobium arenosum]
MWLTIAGAVLLVVGFASAWVLAHERPGVPAEGWFPDPSTTAARRRFWDARAWTSRLEDGGPAADRGRRFRGRFWRAWLWLVVAAAVVLGVMGAVYLAGENEHVLAAGSFLGMALVCCAAFLFVDRQLALRDTVRPVQVAAVAVATAGGTLAISANVTGLIIGEGGISAGTAAVGFVEEGTKLLVPLLLLWLVAGYRDPRAGIAIGLGSGFGFAIAETTVYAYQFVADQTPVFCGAQGPELTPMAIVQAQVARVFTVSPVHWLLTGIATAVAWRLWHLYGRRGTGGAVLAILAVMVVHSLNDSSVTAFCDPTEASLVSLARYALLVVMYVAFKAWSRKSTPPQLIGVVSRGWAPKHLPKEAAE